MHRNKKIALFILIGILSLECCKPKANSIIDEMTFSEEIIHPTDSVALLNLTRDISNLEFVASGPVGLSGKEVHQPDYTHILASTLDTIQLLKLTFNKSPYVRMFAFKALEKIKYKKLKNVLADHLFDMQTYKEASGCIFESIPINVAYFRIIFPLLTKSEADFYREAILKQNNKEGINKLEPSGL